MPPVAASHQLIVKPVVVPLKFDVKPQDIVSGFDTRLVGFVTGEIVTVTDILIALAHETLVYEIDI